MPPGPTYTGMFIDTSTSDDAIFIIKEALAGRAGRPIIEGSDICKSSPCEGDLYLIHPFPLNGKERRHTDDRTWLPGKGKGEFIHYFECVARAGSSESELQSALSPVSDEQSYDASLSHSPGAGSVKMKKQGRASLACFPRLPKFGGLEKYTYHYRLHPDHPHLDVRLIYYTSAAHESAHLSPTSSSYATPLLAPPPLPTIYPLPPAPSVPPTPSPPTYALQLPPISSFDGPKSLASMDGRKVALLRL